MSIAHLRFLSQHRRKAQLGFVKLEQPRYDSKITVCAIQGEVHAMAQWDAPSPTLLPLILRYSFALLSVAHRTCFNPFSKMKFGR
jgi:hypothetical protein